MSAPLTADAFISFLEPEALPTEARKIEGRMTDPAIRVIGVRMKTIFDSAKSSGAMPLDEVERLLDSDFYEARMGAVSILDSQVRPAGMSDDERRARYELYLRRHDRINTWDFVDRAAPRVVGGYLLDKSRQPLFELARSGDIWERRTAITAAFWIIRARDIADPIKLATLLVNDSEHFVQTSTGTALREIGVVDADALTAFLSTHAATMPRTTLRLAVAKLPRAEQQHWLAAGKDAATVDRVNPAAHLE
jgi:3-methyladenine DNA glycosylase AlkD